MPTSQTLMTEVPLEVRAAALTHRCRECASETDLFADTYGIWHLQVRHDDTCPTYQEIQRGTQP